MNIFDEHVYTTTRCIGCIIHSNNDRHHHACTETTRMRSLSPLPYQADKFECPGCRYESPHQLAHIDPHVGCARMNKSNDLNEKRVLCQQCNDKEVRVMMLDRILEKRKCRISYRKQNHIPMSSQEQETNYEVEV